MDYKSLTQLLEEINDHKLSVLIGSTKGCGVCMAIKPRIDEIMGKYNKNKQIFTCKINS